MLRLLTCLLVTIFMASVCPQADAQSLMQTAKKAEQRAKELKEQENTRYSEIIDSRDLTKYELFINDYPKSQNTKEIIKRANEIKMWNDAKVKNTIPAYEGYLHSTSYHWYDQAANEAIIGIKKASERQAWEKVVMTNTIEAYQTYLKDNPSSGFRKNAEDAIARMQAEDTWKKVKNSNNIDELQEFIKTYPNSQEASIASVKVHELLGVKYYNNNNMEAAYNEFSKIEKTQMASVNWRAYDEVMEYKEFMKLGAYASEGELFAFLNKYPNGRHYSQVCDKIALAKVRNLGYNSSESDYAKALSYAREEGTKKLIQSYIVSNKKQKANREKEIRKYQRKQNGGLFNLGFDFMDIGFNGDEEIYYYNFGLLLRLGNFKDRMQMAIGVKPGFIRYEKYSNNYDDYFDYYYEEYEDNNTQFHMPVICQLKLNLFNFSENSRFFIYGKYHYNLLRAKEVEGEMSWGIGCGFAWKHFDWSFYYRKDIGRIDNYDLKMPDFWGMSMIYYWQL